MQEETVQVTRSVKTVATMADVTELLEWARDEARNDPDNGIGMKAAIQPDGTVYLEAGGVQISNVEFTLGDTLIFHGDRFEVIKAAVEE